MMKNYCGLLRFFLVGMLTGLSFAAFAFSRYTMTDLGSPGVAWGEGVAINSLGAVSATSGPQQNRVRAFIWQNNFAAYLAVPGDYSIATGLTTASSICGYWSDSSSSTAGAFLIQNGVQSSLLPLTGSFARAYGLNDNNVVVGASATLLSFSDSVATVWQNGIASSVPGMEGASAAWAINAGGDIVGETAVTGFLANQAFLYRNGNLTILPTLPGFVGGAAYGINEQGHAVGVSFDGTGIGHAVLWKNGSVIDLGFIENDNDGDEGYPSATGINKYDQIVGSLPSTDFDDDAGGFIWEDGEISDLNSLTDNASQWNIIGARAINDSGQIIATAFHLTDDSLHAILLTPQLKLVGFTVSPSTVAAGTVATGTVTLDHRAPQSGINVLLSSSDSSVASVPSFVSVAPGATTATFPVTTHNVTIDKTVTLTATYNAQLTVALAVQTNNPHLSGFVLSPNATYDGQSVTGTLTLRKPAPAGGVRITLTNTNPAAVTIPTSIAIPQGQITKTFTSVTHAPLVSTSATVTATLTNVSIPQILGVHPIVLESFNLNQTSVIGGGTVNGVIHIPVPAPSGGYKITLTNSNSAVVTLPTTVTIPQGALSGTFVITSKPVSGTNFVTITATHGTSTLQQHLQVLPPEVSTFRISPVQVKGGKNVTGTVTLTGKAPTGGIRVHISANPGLASPSTDVTVRAGQTSVSFTITTSAVSITTPVTLTAYTLTVMKTALLTLTH